jgi:hypothetical protein
MLCCATLFFWADVKPRETISGLFGRKGASKYQSRFWNYGRLFIDRLHAFEHDHCRDTAECEDRMRRELYRCMPR